jgi:thiol-disulfide isomerase/thioredoxin
MYNNEYSVCPCCRNMVRRHESRFGLGGGFGHGFRHGLEHGYNQYDREDRRDIMKYRCCPSNIDERDEREIARYYREIESKEKKEKKETEERENYYYQPSYYNSYDNFSRENYEEESAQQNNNKKGHIVLYHWKNCGHCHKMTKPGGSFSDVDKLCKEHPDFHFHCIETDELNGYSHPRTEPHILNKIKEVGSKLNAFPVLKVFTNDGKEQTLENREKFVEEARSKLGNGGERVERRENYQENKKDVVLLYANWCPHCTTLLQKGGKWGDLEKLKIEYPNYNFHKFEEKKDFDKIPQNIKNIITKNNKLDIQGFPTVFLVDVESKSKKEIKRDLENLN